MATACFHNRSQPESALNALRHGEREDENGPILTGFSKNSSRWDTVGTLGTVGTVTPRLRNKVRQHKALRKCDSGKVTVPTVPSWYCYSGSDPDLSAAFVYRAIQLSNTHH